MTLKAVLGTDKTFSDLELAVFLKRRSIRLDAYLKGERMFTVPERPRHFSLNHIVLQFY